MDDAPSAQAALAQLLDRDAIRQLLERYCRGIDRLDTDLVNSVYWDDATDDHGTYKGLGSGFAAYAIPLLREAYDSTQHSLFQSLIELDGDTARAETYFIAYHRKVHTDRVSVDTFCGRYADKLAKRQGEWRLTDRAVVIEWNSTIPDLGPATYDPDDFVHGRRDRTDIAYGGN